METRFSSLDIRWEFLDGVGEEGEGWDGEVPP